MTNKILFFSFSNIAFHALKNFLMHFYQIYEWLSIAEIQKALRQRNSIEFSVFTFHSLSLAKVAPINHFNQ